MSPRPSRIWDANSAIRSQPERLGFPSLLETVAKAAGRATTAEDALRIMMTFDARVPQRVGWRSLSTDAAVGASVITNRRRSRSDEDGRMISAIGLRRDGRTWISAPADAQSSVAIVDDLIGVPVWIRWSQEMCASYEERLVDARRIALRDANLLQEWCARLSSDNAARAIRNLEVACLHAAPLQLYVEDQVYSNFRFNNLPGKVLLAASPQSCLRRMSETSPTQWSFHDASLLYCADQLLKSGGAGRLEEANSTQLRPSVVHEYLMERQAIYRAAGVLPQNGAGENDFDDLATELAAGRSEMRRLLQPYRRIYGVNLHKEECYTTRVELVQDTLAGRVSQRLSAKWGYGGATWEELVGCLEEWVRNVVADDQEIKTDARFANAIEELLADIVLTVMDVTNADIGMTRGLRSLLTLSRALEREDWQGIVSWELPAYYCCVVPSAKVVERYARRRHELTDILWAIAARMQYNAWHFVPGNLPSSNTVEERDYFFPPTAPDLAAWSDQHHRGHVVAGVRFSIRAPIGVTVAGTHFDGFGDIRLLRQCGPPFAVGDLQYAVNASRLVGTVLDALACAVEQYRSDFRIESFDASWYASGLPMDDSPPLPHTRRAANSKARRAPVPVARHVHA